MKIKKISKKRYVGKVYNFHCLPSKNYFSENILVHNCYKGNSNEPATNMTLDQFKNIVDKMPMLTQIAFGITGIQTNPDFVDMMKYARSKGIVPNFTLTGIDLTDDLAKKIAPLVGGLAVSAYEKDKNVCYDTIKKFSDLGVKQTNMHLLVSNKTLPFVHEVIGDIQNDERLAGLNAVVFLGVKPKGRAKETYLPVSNEEYAKIVNTCLDAKLAFGFDSCSAPKFEEFVRSSDLDENRKKQMLMCSESCESSLFSAYINVHGEYWNCSFSEGEDGVEQVNVLEAQDFLKDVWYNPKVVSFRDRLLSTCEDGCRNCPVFNLKG